MSKGIFRTYTDLVGFLARGKFAERCNTHLGDALEALDNQPDGNGEITITVTMKIKCQDGRLDVIPTVKSKLPEEKGFSATPFWLVDGGFSVQHPSQADMFTPREVEPRRDRVDG
jgi:hypothetical protein